MKPIRIRVVGLAAAVLFVGATVAQATPITITIVADPLITVGEQGVGTIEFSGFPASPLPGVLASDPGPGGLASALTYNLLGPPSLVAGDLFLLDPDLSVSDVIRFNPAGTGSPAYPASLVFYSEFELGGLLADTGFPLLSHANTLTVFEVGGGFLYKPIAGQPGFVPDFDTVYSIVSEADVTAVPEPSTLLLVGASGLAALWRARARRTKSIA